MKEREVPALAALDDRARRAAASLRSAIAEAGDRGRLETVVGGLSRNGSGLAPSETGGEHEESEQAHGQPDAADDLALNEIVLEGVVVYDFGQGDERSSGKDGGSLGERVTRERRRVWLAAAAVFVLAVVGVAVVAFPEGDQPPATTLLPGSEYLVAGWLPDGWEPSFAELGDAEKYQDQGLPEGEVAVYGDGRLDDPWTGPVLSVMRYEAAPDDVWMDEEADEITIMGIPGILVEDDKVVRAEGTRPVHGEHHVVTGYNLGSDAVREAAEHLTPDLAIGSESLPEGYEAIARSPVRGIAPYGSSSSGGLRIGYDQPCRAPQCRSTGPGGLRDGITTSLILAQQPASGPEAAEMIRLWTLETEGEYEDEVTEVRGQPAYILRGPGGHWTEASEDAGSPDEPEEFEHGQFEWRKTDLERTTVQWFEPSLGLIVSVSTAAEEEVDVDRFVENLRVADQDELEDLLRGESSAG